MANQQLVQITAWSYSRYTDYQRCPALAKYKHVLRLKEPENEAMARGSEVHHQAQGAVEGTIKKLPPTLVNFREDFRELKAVKAVCEQQWAFNRDWKKVDWFAKDCWLRIMVDVHHVVQEKVRGVLRRSVLRIIDWKTGRQHAEHKDQRSLYALGGILVYPDIAEVEATHAYLDSGETATDRWRGSDLEALQKMWLKNVTPMMNDRRFAPRPGNHCRWCHFRKANGGPCAF